MRGKRFRTYLQGYKYEGGATLDERLGEIAQERPEAIYEYHCQEIGLSIFIIFQLYLTGPPFTERISEKP